MNEVQHMLVMYRRMYFLSVWVRETVINLITWLKILGAENSLKQTEAPWTLKGKVRGWWIAFFLCLSCTWPWPHRRDGTWGALRSTLGLPWHSQTGVYILNYSSDSLQVSALTGCRSDKWRRVDQTWWCHRQMGLQSKELERTSSVGKMPGLWHD